MGTRRSLGFACTAGALALVLFACAEGANDEPLEGAEAGADAAGPDTSLSVPNKKKDGGAGTDPNNPDPDPNPDSDGGGGDGGVDSGGSSGGVSAACMTAIAKASWDFEASDQGWTHLPSDGADQQASWPFDPWSRGTSAILACPSGNCWAGERTQNYAQCSRGELLSPTVDLSACATAKVTLVFKHAYRFWTGSYNGQTWFDGGIVEVSGNGGSSWSVPAGTYPGTLKILKSRSVSCVSAPFHADAKQGFTGAQATPVEFSVTIPAAQLTTKTRLRFSTGAGVSTDDTGYHRENTEPGWRIDDVHFVATPP